MRIVLDIVAFLSFAILMEASVCAQVRVWEGTMALPSYEEGAPDPNPPFDQFATSRFNYPYVLRENLTSHRMNHEWRTVYLENEYLKCSVLPDIGGHLYTCIDKLSGQSMFYDNSSIKKAAVGYRGAWAAFGIEFNFPVSHNWVSMSPVDYAFRQNADGSASVFVGNVDRVYGMEWQVELLLQPGSTVLEQRVRLSNRSDVRRRFYWWNNAAARITDDSRIVYPMRFVASHGFTEVRPWPIDSDGHDLSVIRNHVHGPVSEFVHGSREEFMGVWHPSTKTGTVHFARYEELPAKKIWSWGVDEEGLDWRKALSDDNSGYIEIQAGLFRNQETYAFLEPRQSIRFSEYWMPTRNLEGISRANLAGVVSLTRQGNNLVAGFNANRFFPHSTISIVTGNKKVLEEKADLGPQKAWTHELPIAYSQEKYSVEILDANSNLLMRHTEGVYDWTPESEIRIGPQPLQHIPDPDRRTSGDWLQQGKELELNGNNLEAMKTYQEALRRFSGDFDVMKSAGRLYAALLRFDEAKTALEQVHARDTSDPEISYYLGIAYDGLGDSRRARTVYEEASRVGSYRGAASLRLGEMDAREGNLKDAERHFEEAHQIEPEDVRSIEERAAIEMAAGNASGAKALAQQGLKISPLSALLNEVLSEPNLQQLGNDTNRVLNVAAQYMRLGLYHRALEVLSRNYPPAQTDQTEPGALPPDKHPMVSYHRGYCREQLRQSPLADYDTASKQLTVYVFPSTTEELSVLKAALRANSNDGTAHYLLGTLYFSKGITDSALAEWAMAQKLATTIPVLDASLGRALLNEKHDAENALSAFLEGLKSDPRNETNYVGADQALSLLSRPASDRVQVLEKYPHLANAPSGLIFELILNLAEQGDFQRAESLFHNRFFPREEGGTNVRQVWIEVQLQKITSLSKQNRCVEVLSTVEHLSGEIPDLTFTHDGLDPFVRSARSRYLIGAALASCGKPEEAARDFHLTASASAPDEVFWAWQAEKAQPGFDAKQWDERLRSAMAEADRRATTSSFAGWWYYTAGVLNAALGNRKEADMKFQKALLLPDRMLSYHCTRLIRAESRYLEPGK